jgi:low affinity Fe/Cu permease
MLKHLEHFTHRFAKWAGSSGGFLAALLSLAIWVVTGNYYHFSNGWEKGLTIYIGTITFLMLFLIQRGQNKELAAIHLKLNELIAATQKADNRMISAEELSEKEIKAVQDTHRKIGSNRSDS